MPVWTEDSGSTYSYLDKQVDLEANTTYRIKNSASTDLFTIAESTGIITISGVLNNCDIDGGTIDGSTISNNNITGNTISGNTINNDVTGNITGSSWTGDLTVSGDLTVNGNDINFGSQAVDANILFSRNSNDGVAPTLRIKSINTYNSGGLGTDNWYCDLTTETDGINTVKSYATKTLVGTKVQHVPGENPLTDSSADVPANVNIDAVSLNNGLGVINLGSEGGLDFVNIGSGATSSSPKLKFLASNGNDISMFNRVGLLHIDKPAEVANYIDIAIGTNHINLNVNNSGLFSINDGSAGSGTDIATIDSTLATFNGQVKIVGDRILNSSNNPNILFVGATTQTGNDLRVGNNLQVDGGRINNSSGIPVISFNQADILTGGDLVLGGDKIDLTANATTIELKNNTNALNIGANTDILKINTQAAYESVELVATRNLSSVENSTKKEILRLSSASVLDSNYTDSFVGSMAFSPVINGDGSGTTHTLDRYNYIQAKNPFVNPGSQITDACLFYFDDNAGTHKAIDSGTTHLGISTPEGWIKVNVNGTIHYIPTYTSKS